MINQRQFVWTNKKSTPKHKSMRFLVSRQFQTALFEILKYSDTEKPRRPNTENEAVLEMQCVENSVKFA